jgi:hypothetical protein
MRDYCLLWHESVATRNCPWLIQFLNRPDIFFASMDKRQDTSKLEALGARIPNHVDLQDHFNISVGVESSRAELARGSARQSLQKSSRAQARLGAGKRLLRGLVARLARLAARSTGSTSCSPTPQNIPTPDGVCSFFRSSRGSRPRPPSSPPTVLAGAVRHHQRRLPPPPDLLPLLPWRHSSYSRTDSPIPCPSRVRVRVHRRWSARQPSGHHSAGGAGARLLALESTTPHASTSPPTTNGCSYSIQQVSSANC